MSDKAMEELLENVCDEAWDEDAEMTFAQRDMFKKLLKRRLLPLLEAGQTMRSWGVERTLDTAWDAALQAAKGSGS